MRRALAYGVGVRVLSGLIAAAATCRTVISTVRATAATCAGRATSGVTTTHSQPSEQGSCSTSTWASQEASRWSPTSAPSGSGVTAPSGSPSLERKAQDEDAYQHWAHTYGLDPEAVTTAVEFDAWIVGNLRDNPMDSHWCGIDYDPWCMNCRTLMREMVREDHENKEQR